MVSTTDLGFEEFARARMQALLRYALMLTADEHLAQDLVQETLVRAQLHWRKVVRADHPERYVKRIAVNLYLGWRRGSWTRRTVLVADPVEYGGGDPTARTAERDAVWVLLAGLPRQQRAALVLRYYEELTDTEIAAALGCRVGTVRGYISRAMVTLRAELGSTEVLEGLR